MTLEKCLSWNMETCFPDSQDLHKKTKKKQREKQKKYEKGRWSDCYFSFQILFFTLSSFSFDVWIGLFSFDCSYIRLYSCFMICHHHSVISLSSIFSYSLLVCFSRSFTNVVARLARSINCDYCLIFSLVRSPALLRAFSFSRFTRLLACLLARLYRAPRSI